MVRDVTNVVVVSEAHVERECVVDLLLSPVNVLVVGDLLAQAPPERSTVASIVNAEDDRLHAGVELTVDFLEVDNIEAIGHSVPHVRNFEVEPLMVTRGVDVWPKNQVVLLFGDLQW